MKHHHQLKLFTDEKSTSTFGGSTLLGKRKSARPLSRKRPIHLVLKASDPLRLLRHVRLIEQQLKKFSHRFGVKLHQHAVHADHIHIALETPDRVLYRRWIRAVTSQLARQIAGLKWRHRPYTRIATWGRDFLNLQRYLLANAREGEFILEAHLSAERFALRWEEFASG